MDAKGPKCRIYFSVYVSYMIIPDEVVIHSDTKICTFISNLYYFVIYYNRRKLRKNSIRASKNNSFSLRCVNSQTIFSAVIKSSQ